jgi:hypothetical protein
MGEMNEMLAEYYGTAGGAAAHTTEDQEKVAQVELFTKLAADNQIDLAKLDDTQVRYLWDSVFSDKEKTAAAHGHKHKHGHGEKKAQAEFQEKKAAAEKIAEADFLGRVMAHAMVQELNKIGAEAQKTAAVVTPPAPAATPAPAEKTASMKDRLLKIAGELPPWLNKGKGDKDGDGDGDKGKEKDKDKEKGDKAPPFGKDKEKESSALDVKAAELAVKMASDHGLDPKEAAQKIAAIFTLGVKESTKLASAPNYETGLEIRALELLEQAGYPVKWTE